MIRFFLTLFVALPLLAAAQAKIGVVNSVEIFNTMPEKVAADTLMKHRSSKSKAELDRIQNEFNNKFADYQEVASDAATPEAIKERRIQELHTLDKDIQAFQQSEQKALDDYRAQLVNPILDRIQKAIEEVSEEMSLDIVFDTAKTPVAYTGPYTEDITPRVKARLAKK